MKRLAAARWPPVSVLKEGDGCQPSRAPARVLIYAAHVGSPQVSAEHQAEVIRPEDDRQSPSPDLRCKKPMVKSHPATQMSPPTLCCSMRIRSMTHPCRHSAVRTATRRVRPCMPRHVQHRRCHQGLRPRVMGWSEILADDRAVAEKSALDANFSVSSEAALPAAPSAVSPGPSRRWPEPCDRAGGGGYEDTRRSSNGRGSRS